MDLRFPESEICQWAKKYKIPCIEKELIDLKPEVKQRVYLNKEELRCVARWKSPRRAGDIDKNDDNYVEEITSWAFTAANERSKIEILTLLDGIYWSTASAILHLFHKDPYPILDFRALWSVGLEESDTRNKTNQYSFCFWQKYVCFCRDVACRNQVDMRTLDRALWQYSKLHQPPRRRGRSRIL